MRSLHILRQRVPRRQRCGLIRLKQRYRCAKIVVRCAQFTKRRRMRGLNILHQRIPRRQRCGMIRLQQHH